MVKRGDSGKHVVRKDYETPKRVAFHVLNQDRMTKHSVIYDKERKKWFCDCKWHITVYPRTRKYCSHIEAAKNRILEDK